MHAWKHTHAYAQTHTHTYTLRDSESVFQTLSGQSQDHVNLCVFREARLRNADTHNHTLQKRSCLSAPVLTEPSLVRNVELKNVIESKCLSVRQEKSIEAQLIYCSIFSFLIWGLKTCDGSHVVSCIHRHLPPCVNVSWPSKAWPFVWDYAPAVSCWNMTLCLLACR
jgi:hypothetical protein